MADTNTETNSTNAQDKATNATKGKAGKYYFEESIAGFGRVGQVKEISDADAKRFGKSVRKATAADEKVKKGGKKQNAKIDGEE